MTQEDLKQLTKEQTSNTNNNIVSVGYGYTEVGGKITNELGLVYTVKEKKPLDEIPEEERIPSEITYGGEALPTDVVQSTVRLVAASDCNPEFYEWRTNAPTNRNSFRPLKGGVSIGNVDLLPGYVGTLGFVAIDNESNTLVGVSNNHVLVDDAWIATSRTTTDAKTNAFRENGSLCVQPSEVGANSSNRVGVLKKYVPIDFFGNTVDGALIALDSKDLVNYNVYGEPFEGLTTLLIILVLQPQKRLIIYLQLTHNYLVRVEQQVLRVKEILNFLLVDFPSHLRLNLINKVLIMLLNLIT